MGGIAESIECWRTFHQGSPVYEMRVITRTTCVSNADRLCPLCSIHRAHALLWIALTERFTVVYNILFDGEERSFMIRHQWNNLHDAYCGVIVFYDYLRIIHCPR